MEGASFEAKPHLMHDTSGDLLEAGAKYSHDLLAFLDSLNAVADMQMLCSRWTPVGAWCLLTQLQAAK